MAKCNSFCKRQWIVALLFCFTALPASFSQAADSAPVYQGYTVNPQDSSAWSEYHGVVASRNSVDLIALLSGRIKAVHAAAGQKVRKGQVLVELESDEYRAKLLSAEAQLATAQANLTEARNEHTRFKQLVEQKIITAQQFDKSTAKLESAQAGVAAAEAGAKEARTMFSYTTLKSPMNGIVVNKRINPGDFTIPGLPAELGYPAGRNLMTIYDPNALWFEAKIPERFAHNITVGSKVNVIISSANLSLKGTFVEVVPYVDETSRTFIARVNLPPHPVLKLGMFGRARFASGARNHIEIPERALIERGQLDAVYVFAKDKAQLRLVRCGKRNEGRVEILSGLMPNEVIIANPRESLHDGDPVRVELAAQ